MHDRAARSGNVVGAGIFNGSFNSARGSPKRQRALSRRRGRACGSLGGLLARVQPEGGLVKERDDRLSDWDEIQTLLGGEAARGLLPVASLEERVVRIRYRPEHRPRVDRAPR